jgi:hypothetical protein
MPDEQQSIRIIIFLHGSVDRWSERQRRRAFLQLRPPI